MTTEHFHFPPRSHDQLQEADLSIYLSESILWQIHKSLGNDVKQIYDAVGNTHPPQL